ncbi:class I SAM-dependent methyltransferase [Ewingella americana]|uniref:class I SAM-dependent methyltransferase n=1 Tax=Ewingella americana TaxID=41202 RepID=UPI0012ADA5E2|nr:class I SAM-dependent methyltransferase [Ewingella americana]MRT04075.1 methyltransferase domain-containing protein [Ewingella americana]
MAQNIYDDQQFFEGYSQLNRSVHGLDGAPEWPALEAMLPDVRGTKVVDLGCGYGWFCRNMREQGAAKVLGLDISAKMLEKARSMTADDNIEYRREDLDNLTLPAETYSLAYSSLALHYLQNLSRLFDQVYQSLVPGGHFVFSAEHPIFTAPAQPGWLTTISGQKTWPVDGYQREGERVTNWFAEGVIKQHRKLATYINLLIKSGFIITQVDEWGPSAEQLTSMPALQEEIERPMMFLLAAQKPR